MPLITIPIPGGGEYHVNAADEQSAYQNVGLAPPSSAPAPSSGGGGGAPAPSSAPASTAAPNPLQGTGNVPGYSVDSYAGRQAARDWAAQNIQGFNDLAFNEAVKSGANLQQALTAGGGSVTYARPNSAPAPTGANPNPAAPAPGSNGNQFGAPSSNGAVSMNGRDAQGSDGALYSQQSAETRGAFEAIYGPAAAQFWLDQHEKEIKAAVTPGGAAPGTPAPAANGAPGAAAPATQQDGQSQSGQAGMKQIVTENGAYWVTEDAANAYEQQLAAYAAAQKEAANRAYSLEQGKLSVQQALADSQKAYQDALIKTQNAQLAQQAALAAIDQSYKDQLLELQRQNQAQQLSIQQQQLELSRRQSGRRRGAAVRYA